MAQEDRKLFWSRENEVDEKWIQFVDDNVYARETLQDGEDIVWHLTHDQIYREVLKSRAFSLIKLVIGNGQPKLERNRQMVLYWLISSRLAASICGF